MSKQATLLKFSFVFVLLIMVSGCSKDKAIVDPASKVSFEMYLTDTTGKTVTSFSYGEDIVFRVSMKNTSYDKLSYYDGLDCAETKFRVYRNDSLFGHPHDDLLNCAAVLKLYTLNPLEKKQASINWFSGSQNLPLPQGVYEVTFETTVAYNKSKNWKKIKLSAKFVVY